MDPPLSSLARLGPLIPQLALAWERNRREPPEVLRAAGAEGGRHIGTLVSLFLGGPGTVSELAQRLGMSVAHASLVIGELAKAGLVERGQDSADRRRVVVSLSARAEPAIVEMRKRHAQPLEQLLAELGEEEADVFITHLARLVELMHRTGQPPP